MLPFGYSVSRLTETGRLKLGRFTTLCFGLRLFVCVFFKRVLSSVCDVLILFLFFWRDTCSSIKYDCS